MSESRDITAEHARAAAQIEADVGVEHIADVYAQGLLDATERAGQTAAILDEFDALMADVLDKFPRLETVLASSLVSSEEKSGIIDRVFGSRLSPMLTHFLKVTARHERLDCLRAIHSRMHDLYDKLRNRVPVRLTTATPASAAMIANIMNDLRAKLGSEPILEQTVDASLIGGAILRIGDVVYDGSVANQLKNLREKMSDRSTHEIQSGRDRFRNSAGN